MESVLSKLIKYDFEVIDGELTCTSHTQNVSFDEVEQAIILMRDRLNSQIENKSKCPFYAPK